MVDYTNFDLYTEETVDKQLVISFDGGTITNKDLHQEEFELTESLCSDSQLTFGSCEASEVKFRISNVFTSLKDKWLTITQILNGDTENPFQFGRYKVYSDKPTADRSYRDVVAYDAMYDIINTDLTEWYNSIFPTDDTEIALKEFRTSLMNYLGVEQEDVTLVNDNMVVKKTIQPTQLAGRDVVSAICEINGCFGHIGRDGKFHYVFLFNHIQGLYPSDELYPSDDLFPREQDANKIDNSLCIDCQYEDYLSQRITKLQIRQEENDIGKTYPGGEITDSDNVYVVQGNFLAYGKNETELNTIAKNLYPFVSGKEYRPFKAKVVGNPCFEVGDAIRMNTAYQIVESYILKRTLTGVQGLRDELSADGEEYLSENAGGIESQIQQLKGKSNVLERNINETVSKISDVEQGLQSKIRQTAESITSTVAASQSKYDETGLEISKYGYGNPVGVSRPESIGEYYLNQENGGLYIGASDGHQPIWVFVKYLPLISEELSSQIEQTAESITQTVSKSTSKYDTTGYDITLFGYGTPDDNNYLPDEHNGEYYLDQETGKVYLSNGSHKWIHVNTLKLITDELSSRIEQTISSISLKINNGDKTAGIVITLENEDGTKSEVKGTIEMTGIVTFNDLEGNSQTVINGDYITTGTIDAEKVNVINVVAESVAAENITGEKISGKTIDGGEVRGSSIYSNNYFYMYKDSWNIFNPPELALAMYVENRQLATSVIAHYLNIGSGFDGVHIPINSTIGYSNEYIVGSLRDGQTDFGEFYKRIRKIAYFPSGIGYDAYFKFTVIGDSGSEVAYGITTNVSDTKLKKNIKETQRTSIDKIKLIEFIEFDWKDSKGHVPLGVSANQLETIIPEAVYDVRQENNSEYDSLKNVNTTTLLNYALKAIQEQQEVIENQQKEIDELKKSVSFLVQKIGGGADE